MDRTTIHISLAVPLGVSGALQRYSHPYQVRWAYQPKTFPLAWGRGGQGHTEAFAPEFNLVDSDTHIELTTRKQSLVTKKNRKLRRLKQLYPDVKGDADLRSEGSS